MAKKLLNNGQRGVQNNQNMMSFGNIQQMMAPPPPQNVMFLGQQLMPTMIRPQQPMMGYPMQTFGFAQQAPQPFGFAQQSTLPNQIINPYQQPAFNPPQQNFNAPVFNSGFNQPVQQPGFSQPQNGFQQQQPGFGFQQRPQQGFGFQQNQPQQNGGFQQQGFGFNSGFNQFGGNGFGRW
jgi:hypothetical protein